MVRRLALLRLRVDARGDAVGGEDDERAGRAPRRSRRRTRAALGQRLHDVLVVDDLLAHVHRGAVPLQRALHGLDGAVDAGAVAAGLASRTRLLLDPDMTPAYVRGRYAVERRPPRPAEGSEVPEWGTLGSWTLGA
jgi:hypothetical protein